MNTDSAMPLQLLKQTRPLQRTRTALAHLKGYTLTKFRGVLFAPVEIRDSHPLAWLRSGKPCSRHLSCRTQVSERVTGTLGGWRLDPDLLSTESPGYNCSMIHTFELGSAVISVSVAETILWCESQQLTATIEESDEIKARRSLGKQAGELAHRAFMERDRFWSRALRRKYTDSPLWQRSTELYRQADLGSIVPPLSAQLRTPAIGPIRPMSDCRTEQEREEVVRSVLMGRSKLLRSRTGSTQNKFAQDLSGGRLLLYAPEENLADGASELASYGFFDVHNTPPWDTWVTYSGGTLLSWVPSPLFGLVESGIDVNIENCIRWMD
jgi:hypothetical protein